jgi:hypothetical protein
MDARIVAPRVRARTRPTVRDSRAGQALVEFALGAVVLMVFLGVVFEFGRHYYARHAVRTHVAEAALLAASGRTLVNPETGKTMTRAESVTYLIESRVGSTPVELESVTLDPEDGGGPGDLVEIRARYRFDFLAAPIVRTWMPASLIFTVTSVAKNPPAS